MALSFIPHITLCSYRRFREDELHVTRCIKEYVLLFMLDGTLHFTEDGKEKSIKKGHWYLQRPHVQQSATRPSPNAYYFYIHFKEGLPSNTPIHMPLAGVFHKQQYKSIFDSLNNLYMKSNTAALDFQSQFLRLLSSVIQSTEIKNPRLKIANQAWEIIEQEYCNPHIRQLLEDTLHLSYDYIYKITNQYKKQSPISYMQELRMEKAKELLSNTPLTVENIAYEVGYSEASAFYKAFKKSTFTTPNHYRNLSRGTLEE